ncbi:MAG: hypothetical protein KC621_17245 [Myxococcales bacterium]|nr:hypothetical protein [Myxococcales bacterium]
MAREANAHPWEARVAAMVDAVMADALYWFPVRHHSPNTARHLREAMRQRKPAVVFIEGPPDATALVPYVVHPDTRPPIALYTSFRDDQGVLAPLEEGQPVARFAAWYPLLACSPEYVAMRTAHTLGADVVFIDLPHQARTALAEGAEVPDPSRAVEERITRSQFYQGLAKAAGYRTFDETWDALFEVATHDDAESFRHDLAAFCAAARLTGDPAELALDGTIARERHMWRTITTELASRGLGPEQAMVVCGGFHLFLERDGADPPPIPEGTVQATVTPFSYFRTSDRSGYGAGNRAPRYYQRLWEALEAGKGPDDALLDALQDAFGAARKAGEPLSSADAISVAHTARSLAALRRRPHALLDDLHDAIVTCCCKGDPRTDGKRLVEAITRAAVGTAVGKVTPTLGRLPLVADVHAQIGELELGELMEHERVVVLDLDRREPLSARRSAFLHRLVRIGVPLAHRVQGPSIGTVFRERWRASWSPDVEQALVENVLYGDTVEAAAAAKLAEEVVALGTRASRVTSCWRGAVDMDLPTLAERLEEAASTALDEDVRASSLAAAMVDLSVLRRQAGFRGLRAEVLAELEARAFGRACFRLPEAANVPDEEQPEVLTALTALAEALLADPETHDAALFEANVRSAAGDTRSPFLRGAFLGVLGEIRVVPPEALADAISAYARAPADVRGEAGAFLEGVFAVSRTTLMLGADLLVAAVDDLLRACEPEVFQGILPRLRHAFERLHARQRDGFAEAVARRYGKADARALVTLPGSLDAAVVMARLDAKVAEILSAWGAA